MGKHFGELYKMRHIITYSISPLEQRAFAGYFTKGFPNLLRRVKNRIFRIVPQMVVGYVIYSWATEENRRSIRKGFEGPTE